MKQTRSIITTIIITLSAFTAILYTSCKSSCSHLTCFNGGVCSNGFCSCPYGFTGTNCQVGNQTSIQYFNHSRTNITLNIVTPTSTIAYTILPGQIRGFSGLFGDTSKGYAYTSGPYGETVTWDSLSTPYPANITVPTVVDLYIPITYFYLTVKNDSMPTTFLREFDVNQGLGLPYEQDIVLPPPYLAYGATIALGYFYDTSVSNVYVQTADNNGRLLFSGATFPLQTNDNQSIVPITYP